MTRDRTDRPAPGRYNICYVNAYQSQPGERARWGGLLLDIEDPEWPGEYLVDTRRPGRVAKKVGRWIRGCARHGYDAVEFDNLDSYSRSHGLLSRKDNLRVLRRLARAAHMAGLAVGQKNAVEISRKARRAGADFAVAEQCQRYAECHRYQAVYGDRWMEIEYRARDFRAACAARGGTTSVILRDVDVVPRGERGYRYRTC